MAIHILRSHLTTFIFVVVIAIGAIGYFFPDAPYIGMLSQPITAFFFYAIAFMILFYPKIQKRAFFFALISLILAWAAVWWFFVKLLEKYGKGKYSVKFLIGFGSKWLYSKYFENNEKDDYL